MAGSQRRSIPGIPDEVANRGDLLTREEAIAVLGIKPQTLYCYVSRGFIRRVPQPDGRSSFYLREDVEGVRAKSAARSGHGPAAASAMRWGEPVISTGITEITGLGPKYRNRLATDLAQARYAFENIAEYLWGGDLAEEPVTWRRIDAPAGFANSLAEASALHPRAHLLQLLTIACTALGIAEGTRRERIQSGATPVQGARRLIRTLTGTFGFFGPLHAYVDLEDGEPIADGLLRALGAAASAEKTRATNAALALVADHELNPATFAARIAASASADLHCCIGAALRTQQGTLIGGACDRLEQLFAVPARSEQIVSRVRDMLESGREVPGFNHRLYPNGDPRARMLLELAREIGGANIGVRHMLESLARLDEEFKLNPSIECGLVFIARALGLPGQVAGGIFALGRCAGWGAHVMEQRLAGFMIRPRARFAKAAPP